MSAILTDTGSMVEWVKYSAYGVPFALPAGDTDADGDWDAADQTAITGSLAYDVRHDANLDGVVAVMGEAMIMPNQPPRVCAACRPSIRSRCASKRSPRAPACVRHAAPMRWPPAKGQHRLLHGAPRVT